MANLLSLGSKLMKKYFLGLSVLTWTLILTTSLAAAQNHVWSQQFGDTNSDQGLSIAVDASGNVLVTGRFTGTVDFGGGPLTSAGSDDIFLAKYDASGTHLWSQRFGGIVGGVGMSVSVDGSGNVVVTGVFRDTVDFGGGPLTSAGSDDIFLAKYDASGTHLWSQRFGSTSYDQGWSVAVDASGNVVVTGAFTDTVDFGGGGLTSAGSFDIFLAKYDASGTHLWSQRFGDTSTDLAHGVTVDGSGNVVVTGIFSGTADFGGGGLTSAGFYDIFLAKYDASGTHLWSQRFGDTSTDGGDGVTVDGSGNVFVTGIFKGTVDFGGGPLITSGGSFDIFLAKYNASGTHLWSQRFGGTSSDEGQSVGVDGSGNVVVTGFFTRTADFGGGSLISSGGSFDIFLAKYDASGTHLWSQRFGSTANDRGWSVNVDGTGNVVVTGYFRGTVDFGGSALTSAGNEDIFLAKYAAPNVAVAISSFDARAVDEGVALYSSFASDLRVLGVNVYRGEGSGRLLLYENVSYSGGAFYYEDRNIKPGCEYRYQIGVVDQDGEFFSQIVTVTATGYEMALLQNAPNPFNPTTTIYFALEETQRVSISIYDAQGRHVRTLFDDMRSAGPHTASWDGRDDTGVSVGSGVYFYQLSAGKLKQSKRMVLLK